MPGVKVGKHCLISTRNWSSEPYLIKSIAPHTVVGGNPARYICTTEEFYERNKDYSIGRRLSKDEKKNFLLNTPDTLFIKK